MEREINYLRNEDIYILHNLKNESADYCRKMAYIAIKPFFIQYFYMCPAKHLWSYYVMALSSTLVIIRLYFVTVGFVYDEICRGFLS